MWYVVQVPTGREQTVCDLINRAAKEHEDAGGQKILKECFAPTFLHEWKYGGTYITKTRNLFPGYVVAITKHVDQLNRLLRGVSAFTKILGNDKAFIPLDRTEMAFINSFTTEKRRVIQPSRAVMEGDQIRVIDGPLMGYEACIKQIRRRKGTALVEIQAFKRTLIAEIGLSVLTKA